MTFIEKWIWLPKEEYPENQTTIYSAFLDKTNGNYTVAEFQKTYAFDKKVVSAKLRFSGDTQFELYCNGELLATGPVLPGGDFRLGSEKPRPNFYASELLFSPDVEALEFYARVTMMPMKLCEYSKGHGGFMMTAEITFADGTKTIVCTDKTWKVRRNGAYTAPYCYDTRLAPDAYVDAEEKDNIWHTITAPIPVRTEEEIFPIETGIIHMAPHQEKEVLLNFDKVYSGFVRAKVQTEGTVYAEIFPREIEEVAGKETLIFKGSGEYRGNAMHSAGNFRVVLKNESDMPSEISLSFIFTCYPVEKTAMTTTSDPDLNAVLDVCRHTLKICRQTIHLDSPRHCEPLACTGDYYIETLMTAFSFGDMRLAELDVERTAVLLRNNDGRMFHTTYSLIWVRMLYDVYRFTGNTELLRKCEDALILLLNRFETYLGDNGLIETPPDYTFVDWIYLDEFSLHHPPKALGQTCLNMFYFGALDVAAKIYEAINELAMAKKYNAQKEQLRSSINTLLFDEEKGLYFEGLNTKTPEHLLAQFMPQNTEKRYYLKHSNILAAYVGVCDRERLRDILDKIMSDECPGAYQPYFAHFLLEAIYENGMREQYTLKVLDKWKESALACPKGLIEGFIEPNETYVFDHSHAWGGTPLYSLPKALLGLEITEPGLLSMTLRPSLMGLESARVELPTPYGEVVCEMRRGEEPVITYPKEVKVCVE